MPAFISLSSFNELDTSIKLEQIGQSTGFLGLGRKIYLVYDEDHEIWGIRSLNIIERIVRRLFGFYQETHRAVVEKQLRTHPWNEFENYDNLIARIEEIWDMSLSFENPVFQPEETKERFEAEEEPPPLLDSKPDFLTDIASEFQKALKPDIMKNIQAACLFGDWKGMGFNTDNEAVRKGKELTLLETIATELPELKKSVFINIKGNGECGFRTLVTGLIHGDCIRENNIDRLKETFQKAFDELNYSWWLLWNKSLFAKEKKLFESSKEQVFAQLDRVKDLSIPERIALLQEEAPFLAPFLTFIRCMIVSQTKCIAEEKHLEKTIALYQKRVNELYASLRTQADLTEKEEKSLSYALNNYSLRLLLSDHALNDIVGNASYNLMKEELKALVKRVSQANDSDLVELSKLIYQEKEMTNKFNILTAPLIEAEEEKISLDEFLRQKALGNADSPRPYWAVGSDFVAVGYALNKNICCIYRDEYKENAFGVQKTFPNQVVHFYGLNMTGQAHYNALLPLILC